MKPRGSKHVGDTRNYKLNINFGKLFISLAGVVCFSEKETASIFWGEV